MKTTLRALILAAALFTLAACGNKGALVLPDKPASPAASPASPAASPASSAG